ncbi:protein translocase subunit secF [Leifsonia sp. 98AMF]|uniref:protein translocase subunit SecF n=1 Tax=unclassified Leifsonia TaxID=2663824 RepID=UPI00087D7CAC|nr:MULTISPECIES: protein translocase subunit SecF [unclassified Leifsonia]SDH39929.1 protein translocase subunit secF [Leifsonia sp. 197AMF]SDI96558.1 protein translocase subunit secF [Leifsonia sp. 466MF]SDJ79481.1 protein translocase subunit secF [Leifsonia sp. 157MF]SDN99841.1 protein translocase subunit secF [Leifsonia sp. 509MF]SEN04531.1 protein translocase subunit secF [Leifsonia sp. 467MF]
MASRLVQFGNDLYTGARSIDFVGRRKIWYSIAAVMVVLSILVPIVRGGFNFSIEFRGGSQFQVSDVSSTDTSKAQDAVSSVVPSAVSHVSVVGDNAVRVQTDQLSETQTREVSDALAKAYDVDASEVSATFIGPSWGADVTQQSIQGLVVFLLLAFIAMALYFRTWKMSAAAIISLFHDLIITAGVYALVGFEVSPATMIGFLTILGYSLYDTVVVFDKIRENTKEEMELTRRTFAESVNLAVNQTLVRSINTAVVAVLPVASILFIGAYALGAATLRDISLALLIGIIVGTYSTIFLAAPMYSQFREKEPAIRKHDQKVLSIRPKAEVKADAVAAAAE